MTVPPTEPSASPGLPSRLRTMASGDLFRAGVHTYGLSLATLAANLVSGIASARGLAPQGRGETAAIHMLAQNIGFVFTFGCMHAVSYRFAREPESGARLLTVWLVLLAPLALLGIGAGELALPALFDAQSDEAVAVARVYLATIVLVLLGELLFGLLLGDEDFLFVNVTRLLQPALIAVVLVVLWRTGALTVESQLVTTAAATALVLALTFRRALRRTGGLGRFDPGLARETFSYGFRGQGVTLAGALNQRLDLLILPAFVASASIGFYSVAANVSLIVFSLASSFSVLVLPAAVRRGVQGPRTVIRSLQAVGAIALGSALALAAVAEPALRLVYGEAFVPATETLRLLLPGTALLAGASILIAGLYAANRPGLATLTEVTGLVVTLVGLLVFLPSGGITAAAIVSSVAYGTVFVVALVAYRRATALPWRAFARPPDA